MHGGRHVIQWLRKESMCEKKNCKCGCLSVPSVVNSLVGVPPMEGHMKQKAGQTGILGLSGKQPLVPSSTG